MGSDLISYSMHYEPTILHKKILNHTIFLINKENNDLCSGVLIKFNGLPFA